MIPPLLIVVVLIPTIFASLYRPFRGRFRKAMAVSWSGMAEAPDTNGEQCSVREQLLRAQTRLQEMQVPTGQVDDLMVTARRDQDRENSTRRLYDRCRFH